MSFEKARITKTSKQETSRPFEYYIIREQYHDTLAQYKKLLNSKKNDYYNAKISELEKTADNSDAKTFWQCLKSGGRSDPANYRGICVSSCLGKLFCSILNHRLLEYIASLNILHKSQIGFLPNRTADHVFTLRTLIHKYVRNHNEKIYACMFCRFQKSFWLGLAWRALK